jgi:hypothetical protein
VEQHRRKIRTRAVRALLATATIGAVAIAAAAPAYAHHPVLSGQVACSHGEHVVTWTIGNSESNKTMTVASATAEHGGSTYPVEGYSPTVGPSGSTQATTTLPGAIDTGTVTLTVTGSWPGVPAVERSTSVELTTDCTPTSTSTSTSSSSSTSTSTSTSTTEPTTTTTESSTSTTVAGNTSSLPASTTSTTEQEVQQEGSTTTPGSVGGSGASAGGSVLPFTGGGTGLWIGLLAAGAGAVLLVARPRISRRG